MSTVGQVGLPSVDSFKSHESMLATGFHELIHATGNRKRLNRNIENEFGSINYAKEELVAEIGSIFLCNKCGIDSDKELQNHGEYLKGWLSTFAKDDKKDFCICHFMYGIYICFM